MNTIILTPNTATGSITIDIEQLYNVVRIVRTNANGSAEVRVAEGQLPANFDRLIVTDYEAAHGVNTYNAYLANGTFDSATTTLNLEKPWLIVPIAPNYSEEVEVITNISAGRNTQTTVHTIIGRADPLVVQGKLGTRMGTLELWAADYEDSLRLTRVFDRGEAVLLKQRVPGMDMYFAVTGISVDPYSVEGPEETIYRVGVQYQEVKRPYGFLAGGLGWTFEKLANDYESFDSVTAAFLTFDDLTLGHAQSAVSDFD